VVLPAEERRLPGAGSEDALRGGTAPLIRALRERGFEVWIYTTSSRPVLSIRFWLWCHGIWIDGAINQSVHESRMRALGRSGGPTKHPPLFGIALHVDDSEGVRLEGLRHGFPVVLVRPDDRDWARRVLEAAASIAERGRTGPRPGD
jgi:hypothetical protein